jgi:EAL domain-containing protein (putative c-di-GMP-specific phosphodiesterase class I)
MQGGTMTPAGRVLVIDDDADIGEIVCAAAQTLGLPCTSTTDAETFFQLAAEDTTLMLVDLMMPGMDGIEVLRHLGEKKCKASIVLMSGIDRRVMETARKLAQTLGLAVVGHLQKPFRLADLEAVLRTHTVPEAPEPVPDISQINIPDEHLLRAVEENQFLLHYQPQIDIATGRVIGVEALVRWQHPERGLIYPDHFISRAESLELIDRLGWIVMERGLDELQQFGKQRGDSLHISFNVSVYSLRDLQFPDRFMQLTKQHRVPPERIVIEITETGLINEPSHALDVLTRLRMKNIQLSIDDFGTGYSMMRQLQNVPATEIKIDKIFVQNMHSNDSDRVMVQKIIEIGHELGMKVVAEGVETLEQLALLRQNSCDGAQGYLFSRPLPPGELAQWLETYQA